MGWRGALRSLQAAGRAAERDARRRQRELDREQKQYERMQALEQAAHDVEVFENYLDRLHSLHKDGAELVDWSAIAAVPEPEAPVRSSEKERKARAAADEYEPGAMATLLGRGARKQASLEEAVRVAREVEEVEHRQTQRRYEEQHQEWKESSEVAARVLAGDIDAYKEAIEELAPFGELDELGSKLTVEVTEPKSIEALLHVFGEEVIPRESKSLLKSGKLSVKQMPAGRFYDLYQDYVCSCVLRVARDLLAILPVEAVVVTALDNLLNTQTGHLEEQPILSVVIPRASLEQLNLDAIDPSDSMRNFVHQMSFKKTKGFAAVKRLTAADFAG